MPRSESVGPELVALGGVVVDHVEDDLDAGRVQRAHHRLELAHRGHAAASRWRVADVRREEAERVVAPVVASGPRSTRCRSSTWSWTGSSSTAVTPEVAAGARCAGVGRQAGVGAAERLGHVRVQLA